MQKMSPWWGSVTGNTGNWIDHSMKNKQNRLKKERKESCHYDFTPLEIKSLQ